MDSPGAMNWRIFCLTFLIVALVLGLGPDSVTSFDVRCYRSHWDHDVIILPHPNDCRKFLKCDQNYEAIEKSCPSSLEFDPTLKICDWPKGFCAPNSRKPVDNVMNCNNLADAYQPNYEDDCRSFHFCSNGVARTGRCIPNTRFDIKTQKCIEEHLVQCDLPSENVGDKVPADLLLDNDEVSMYPNYANLCRSYFSCENGYCREKFCHDGTQFDSITLTCFENAYCHANHTTVAIQSRTVPSNIECLMNQNQGKWYVDEEDCTKFYVCANGKAYRQQCNPGQYFDQIEGSCLSGFSETCRPQPLALWGCGCPCGKYQDGEKIPDLDDPSKYYVCNNGVIESKTCSNGYVFNPVTLECVRNTTTTTTTTESGGGEGGCKICGRLCVGDLISNLFNNKSYYECEADGHLRLKYCRPNELFNGSFCDGIVATPAPENCTDGEIIPDYNNTQNFYVCANGIWNLKSCLLDQVFDPVLLMCVPDTGIPTPNPEKCTDGELRPDYNNTNNFYVCANGIWNQKSCLADQVFDPVLLMCVPDVTTTTTAPEPNCTDGELRPDYTNTKNFYVCANGIWNLKSCLVNQVFDPELLMCVPNTETTTTEAPEKLCTDGEFLPDYYNNANFYVCVNGVWNEATCPSGQVFDATELMCVPKTEQTTTTSTTLTPEKDCGILNAGGRLPDAFDNTKYYVCIDGYLRHQSCSEDHYFDDETLECITDAPTTTIAHKNCGTIPEGGLVPDDTENNKYYVCVDGVLEHKICPVGSTFEPQTLQCSVSTTPEPCINCGSTPDGATIADPLDDTKYYVCVHGDLQHLSCPKDYYFDASKLQCISTIPTTTPMNRNCESTPDGELIADPLDDNSFYICLNGSLYHRSCPVDSYFDSTIMQCVSTVSTTTPKYLDCGQTPNGGFLPDESNNSKFYVCVNGTLVHRSCPEYSYFDKESLMCISTVPTTTEKDDSCGPVSAGAFIPDEFDDKKFYVCVAGVLRHVSCPENQTFDKTSLMCVTNSTATTSTTTTTTTTTEAPPGSKNCGDIETGGVLPDAFDNTKFYVCVDGYLNHVSCSAGMVFDKESLWCVATTTSSTTTSTTPEVDLDCGPDLLNGAFLPDVFNRTSYYVCVEGVLQQNACPGGMVFDAGSLLCVATTTSSTTTTTSSTTTSTSPSVDVDCGPNLLNGEFLPDVFNETNYYVCVEGVLQQNACPDGMSFDIDLLMCTASTTSTSTTTESSNSCGPNIYTGDFLPDDFDSTKYYVCVYGYLRHLSCPDGWTFDKTQMMCVSAPPKNCGDIPNGNITSDPNDCKLYLICVDGELESRACDQVIETENPHGPCECLIEPPKSCGDIPNGNITSDPNDCKSFLLCVNGELESRKCDQVTETENPQGPCECLIEPPKNCGNIPNGNITSDPNDCKSYLLCVNGELESRKCDQVTETENPQGPCECLIEPPKSCGDIPNGNITSDPNDCTSYLLCVDGDLVSKRCEQVTVTENPVRPCECPMVGEYLCDAVGNLVPDYYNSTCYYICVPEDLLNHQCCPDGMEFNGDGCSFRGAPKTESTPTATSETTSNAPTTIEATNCGTLPSGSIIADIFEKDKYFVCVDGSLNQLSCSEGMVFDPILTSCVLEAPSSTTTTAAGTTNCGDYPSGSLIPDDDDNTKYYVCVNGFKNLLSCEAGWVFDPKLLMCVKQDETSSTTSISTTTTTTTSPGNCDEYPNGSLVPDSDDNTKFYVCDNGKLVQKSCDAGWIFDPTLLMCVKVETTSTTTPSTSTTTSTTVSPSTENPCDCGTVSDGGFLPDLFDNKRFYVCVCGTLRHVSCPAGQTFDIDLNMCMSVITTTEPPSMNCGSTAEGGRLPDAFDKTKFYVCVQGILRHQSCPSGETFDTNSLQCTIAGTTVPQRSCGSIPSEGRLPDEFNLKAFYVCIDGTLRRFMCGSDSFFDKTSLECRTSPGSTTTITTEPTTTPTIQSSTTETPEGEKNCGPVRNGQILPDTSNLNKFYVCVDGTLNQETCPTGWLFDQVNLYCYNCSTGEGTTTTASGASTTTVAMEKDCGNTQEGQMTVDYSNSQYFFVCIAGTLQRRQCPTNQRFDQNKLVCSATVLARPPIELITVPGVASCNDLPSGAHLQHQTDSTKYYICVMNMLQEHQCPPGFIFDKKELYCRANYYQ